MTFWNYIGEFLLFRWLLGKFRKSASVHNTHAEVSGALIDRNSEYLNGNHDEDMASDDAVTYAGDNLLDDSDNSEGLDDLNIFMRNNSGNNRTCLHHGDYNTIGRHSIQNDWSSGSYSQSCDDFLDEQDDYDMLDDDF